MTDVTLFELFKIPVFSIKVSAGEKMNDKLIPLFKDLQKKDINPYPYTIGGYTNYGSQTNILVDLPECGPLKKEVLDFSEHISKELSIFGQPYIENSWFSINNKYSYHESHKHLPSVWSGVYYVKAKEDDAKITFEHKEKQNSSWPFYTDHKHDYTTNAFSIKPISGNLLFFPSYLSHRVEQQCIDQERITISFNIGMKQQ